MTKKSGKSRALSAVEFMDSLPEDAAGVIIYPGGMIRLMLPKHDADDEIADDSPEMLASLAGIFLSHESFEDLRVQALARMKEMN